jgi:acetyl-CoA carboxylase biotin carboxyl carrier protein
LDPKDIRELIEMISHSNFSTFELEEADGFKLKLVKKAAELPAPVAPAPVQVVAAPAVHAAPVAAAPAAPAAAAAAPAAPAAPVDDGLVDFDSPIVGTFYRSPGPDSPAFADVGQMIKKGQVLCIVEAMKVMNEIESEIDAEVVEVRVADGQPVEFGEVLFRLRPLG